MKIWTQPHFCLDFLQVLWRGRAHAVAQVCFRKCSFPTKWILRKHNTRRRYACCSLLFEWKSKSNAFYQKFTNAARTINARRVENIIRFFVKSRLWVRSARGLHEESRDKKELRDAMVYPTYIINLRPTQTDNHLISVGHGGDFWVSLRR